MQTYHNIRPTSMGQRYQFYWRGLQVCPLLVLLRKLRTLLLLVLRQLRPLLLQLLFALLRQFRR